MKRPNLSDKLDKKRRIWAERTADALQVDRATASEILNTKRQQSIRLNALRQDPAKTLAELVELGWKGERYPWVGNGYSVRSDMTVIRDSDLVASGKVFIQNASSWLPVIALDPQPEERILDVCAAPGGKTSHIAELSKNRAEIWANDNSRPRLARLRANMERLNATVAHYTLYEASFLARKLESQQYDKILLDAPCSGEGLMRLDQEKDLSTWSVAQIKRLQQLQKRLLTQAWQLLKPGGTLVYSTCTMAPEEDEAVIDYILRSQTDAVIQPIDIALANRVEPVKEWNGRAFSSDIQYCVRLQPSPNLEAFFVCKLTKKAT
jgi:NOL1/NOP2/sun family putative RNA methylase